MPRKRKPRLPPNPSSRDERQHKIWEQQERVLSEWRNFPRWRIELEKLAKLIQEYPVTRDLRQWLQRAYRRAGRHDNVTTSAAKSKRRSGSIKLTKQEIADGIAIVRNADAEQRRRHPIRQLKQTEALLVLGRELKRNGRPISVSDSTLLRLIVRPAMVR